MQKELIKLANHLDRLGRKTEADYLDVLVGAISKAAQDKTPVTWDAITPHLSDIMEWTSAHQDGIKNLKDLQDTLTNEVMTLKQKLAQNS